MSHSKPLPHPERVGFHFIMNPVLHPHALHRFHNSLLGNPRRHPRIMQQILVPGQKFVHFRIFHNRPDRRNRPLKVAFHARSLDEYIPFGDRHQSDHHPDGRRLAGSVRPDKTEHLARRYIQRQTVDQHFRSDSFGDVLNSHDWFLRHTFTPSPDQPIGFLIHAPVFYPILP
ncbi:hypothetical protein D1872_260720 [compost metagenome]